MGHISHVFTEHLYDGGTNSVAHDQLFEIQDGRIARIEKAEPNAEYGDGVLRAKILAPGFTMASPDIFAGIIADGHHVHPLNIKMAYDLMGPERLILVSDAMQTLAGESKEFDLVENRIMLQNGKLVDTNGALAGAHLAMDRAVQYLVNILAVPISDAVKMASLAPAAALGLQAELGKIMPGYRASFTLLDQDFSAQGVVVDGVFFNTDGVLFDAPLMENYGGLGGHY